MQNEITITIPAGGLGEMVDRMAQAMWQGDSQRCAGRARGIPWAEAGAEAQAKWCQLAFAALSAMHGDLNLRDAAG